jgi:hypothetical protein
MKVFKSLALVAALVAIVAAAQGCGNSNDVTGVNGGGSPAATETLVLKVACSALVNRTASGEVTGVNVGFSSGTITLNGNGTPLSLQLPSAGTYTVTFHGSLINQNTNQYVYNWAGSFTIGSGATVTETFPC